MEEGLQEVEEAVHVYHCGQRAASASVFMGLTHHEKRGGGSAFSTRCFRLDTVSNQTDWRETLCSIIRGSNNGIWRWIRVVEVVISVRAVLAAASSQPADTLASGAPVHTEHWRKAPTNLTQKLQARVWAGVEFLNRQSWTGAGH